jgi:hypothetical protein
MRLGQVHTLPHVYSSNSEEFIVRTLFTVPAAIRRKWSLGRVVILASAIATVVGLAAAPAQAGQFSQYWPGWSQYRASLDFVPNASPVYLGGMGCAGGSATVFGMILMKTSNHQEIFDVPDRVTNGSWWHAIDSHSVQINNAYYLRWYGWANPNHDYGQAPCAGVEATW